MARHIFRITTVVAVVVLLSSSSVSSSEDLPCLPLSDCPALDLLANRGQEFGFSRRQILGQLRGARCGLDSHYRCPATQVAQGELLVEVDGGAQFGGGMTGHKAITSDCVGSLRIFRKLGGLELSPIALHGNADANFFRRSTMAQGEIVLIQVDGNCCWTLFQRENRRGGQDHLTAASEVRPTFQPAAFRKFNC